MTRLPPGEPATRSVPAPGDAGVPDSSPQVGTVPSPKCPWLGERGTSPTREYWAIERSSLEAQGHLRAARSSAACRAQ